MPPSPCRPSRLVAVAAAAAGLLLAMAGSAVAVNPLGAASVSNGEMQVNYAGGGGAATVASWVGSSPQSGRIAVTLSAAGWDISNLSQNDCTHPSQGVVNCAATSLVINMTGMTASQTINAGGSFNATLIGGSGDDFLVGGGGNDLLRGMRGADSIAGGAGIDSADYTSQYPEDAAVRTQGVTVTLDSQGNDGSSPYDGTGIGGMGGDNVHGGVENVLGTDHHDTLSGDAAANLLSGFRGNDTLTGGAGSDRLTGSWGDDTLRANDGEADAEVNCNNSDGSGSEQPNTAQYDAGLDSPVNCSVLIPLGGSGDSGGSGGGDSPTPSADTPLGRARTLQASSIPSVERAGSWTVPAEMEPKYTAKGPGGRPRWDFTDFSSLRQAAKDAPMPIRIAREYVGSNKVPSAQRKFIADRDIVSITPGGGSVLTGSDRAPAQLSVRIYDELLDIKKGSCPYRGVAIGDRTLTEALNRSKGVALGAATRKLTSMGCQWVIAGSRLSNDDEPAAVSFIRSAAVDKVGPSKYVVRLNVVHPAQSLDLLVGPRDPGTLAGNAGFADRAGREMTLDERGLLHKSVRTPTTISVQPIVRSVGKPIRGNTKIVVAAKDGSVLASQEGNSPNGVATFTFAVPNNTTYVTVSATSTAEDGVSTLNGERRITVKGRGGLVRLIDGRCAKPKPTKKWGMVDCPASSGSSAMAQSHAAGEAESITPLPYAVRWKVIDVLLGAGDNPAPTYARAVAVCEAATPAPSGGFRPVYDQMGPSRCLADASMQALIREFQLVPALLQPRNAGACSGGLAAATAPISFERAAAFVDGQLRVGTTPTAKVDPACGVLGVYVGSHFFMDQSHYLSTSAAGEAERLINLDGGSLINLDGGGLINLDGGSLINLDGGGLINLDGGGLINLDGGTLQGAVLRGADGVDWAAQSPPTLISDRGAGLVSDMGGAMVPVRIDPKTLSVGDAGLLGKVK